ncbi:MAG: 16S rRNA (guanine(527)-N(7))-methyltransferase RsmG [Tissierellia bacterium]|nr:16S rRNA (guanine(527)-N(7))-methyltransferase RsmG [Tissierellia bacterium]MDD3225917.1 16S rRNA (guanine(527)-N(7))-methyltransferase RsmG [Tissierellia bacterium]MDD3750744.1 16S rRNA (guanine(527)-N(7))-methyltransferase RsmG [Tissierellia bacterium]MDD4045844.1 16S rRNA (guanine(527)-N(7))-methyltransferase RsmG [Tissierellia bacterium]MDD4678038.1 16S rRNA (guanine(527)-N(7))-methyltransferase RsmG [Tissierellia bacterium]
MIKTMEEGFAQLKLPYSNEIEKKFIVYTELLKEWNKKINITSIEDDEEIYIKHFIDSVLLLNEDNINENKTIIDVGTGGGFPGLPLKIINNNYKLTLLDSLRKRIDFLSEVTKALELNDVKLIHGRAEDYGQNKEYRECYDICVSRAVAPLNVLSEYCIPFVRVGGYFAAFKSDNISQEISNSDNAIKKLGGKIKEIKEIYLPGTDIIRKIVIIEKIDTTKIKYPRKAGKPSKDPLK